MRLGFLTVARRRTQSAAGLRLTKHFVAVEEVVELELRAGLDRVAVVPVRDVPVRLAVLARHRRDVAVRLDHDVLCEIKKLRVGSIVNGL